MRRALRVLSILLCLAVAAAATAQGTAVAIRDLAELTGKYRGKLTTTDTVDYELTIRRDGRWSAVSPRGESHGSVSLQDGKIVFRSDTTGREGVYEVFDRARVRAIKISARGVSGDVTKVAD